MKNLNALMAISVFCAIEAFGQQPSKQSALDDTRAKLEAVPAEMLLADGSLRIVNIYKLELTILSEFHDRSSSEIVDRLVREVYVPYASFWEGYLGDEGKFGKWASSSLLLGTHRSTLESLLASICT